LVFDGSSYKDSQFQKDQKHLNFPLSFSFTQVASLPRDKHPTLIHSNFTDSVASPIGAHSEVLVNLISLDKAHIQDMECSSF
jgi:hypothetical protein